MMDGVDVDALIAASAGNSRVQLLRGLHAADAFTDTFSCGKCVFVFETVPAGHTYLPVAYSSSIAMGKWLDNSLL